METKIKIAASILSADFSCLDKEIKAAERAGADWIHIDVMDGHFVPNLTMGPFIVETCRRMTELPLDVHLMVDHPERLLVDFINAGATILSIHVENNANLHRTLQIIKDMGCKAGIVLNPGTDASRCTPVLHMADIVLVMSVNPGFSGQKFLPEVLPKVSYLANQITEMNFSTLIEIDGGINATTLPQAFEAGASVFVAASAIFKYPDGISAGIASLRNSVK
jgi:ribulose-phosphate 3-epimerase